MGSMWSGGKIKIKKEKKKRTLWGRTNVIAQAVTFKNQEPITNVKV